MRLDGGPVRAYPSGRQGQFPGWPQASADKAAADTKASAEKAAADTKDAAHKTEKKAKHSATKASDDVKAAIDAMAK